MSIFTSRPRIVRIPDLQSRQRSIIIHELEIRERVYRNHGRTYKDRAAVARADEIAEILTILEAQ